MASRKPRLTQAQKSARADLARLKRKGLFKGNVKRPSRYGVKLAKSRPMRDVLAGRSAVVTAPTTAAAKQYSDIFTRRGKKVIVPKDKGQRVKFNKAGEIVSSRKAYGKKVKTRIPKERPKTIDGLPVLRKGEFYTIPFGSGGNIERYTFSSLTELRKFMAEYQDRYKNWQKYVEIETMEDGE